jgi:Ca2+-binding EF-hand superfamily protein
MGCCGDATKAAADEAAAEELLKAKFDEVAKGKESIDKASVLKVLKELGKTDEESKALLAEVTKSSISYRDFQLIAQSPKDAFLLHDIPVIGYLTVAVADSMYPSPADEVIKDAFEKKLLETSSDGKLDKTEVATALRYMGKSERQIQKLIDYCEPEISLEQFAELVKPGPKPWLTYLGPVPVPNHEKVMDVPVVGHTLHLAGGLLQEPTDWCLRRTWRSLHTPTEGSLRHTFNKLDADHSGKLSKKELGAALRTRGQTEVEIKRALDAITEDVTCYEFKDLVRGKKFPMSILYYVPIAGPALCDHILNNFSEIEVDEDDMEEAFNFIDKNGNKKLDKTEIAVVLRELGKSEQQVQSYIDSLEQDELDFEGFKVMMEDKPRPYITELGGLPVPNLAKIHDLPIVGMLTKFAQAATYDCYDWTLGQAFRTFRMLSEEDLKAKFDELDTDKKGALGAKEVAKALRELGHTERQITRMCTSVPESGLTFDDFKALVAPFKMPVYMGGDPPAEEESNEPAAR